MRKLAFVRGIGETTNERHQPDSALQVCKTIVYLATKYGNYIG